MNDWIQQLVGLPPGLEVAVKATALLVLAWMLHLALRRGNPRWRVLLWRGACLGLVLIPLLTLMMPKLRFVVPMRATLPAGAGPEADVALDAPVGSPSVALEAARIGSFRTQATMPSEANIQVTPRAWLAIHWSTLGIGIWTLVSAFLAMRWLGAYIRVRRMVASSTPAPERTCRILRDVAAALGCRKQVELRCSATVQTPFLAGIRRPMILLPQHMADPDYADELPGILAHELTHFRSHDLPWTWLISWITIPLWFHPLTWRIRRAHAAGCELACDAGAADYLHDRNAYSRTLARVVLTVVGRQAVPVALPMARSPEIMTRLAFLKRGLSAAPLAHRSVVLSAGIATILVVLMAGLGFAYAERDSAVLQFPPDRSLGVVFVRDPGVNEDFEVGWERLAEARGDVRIPIGKEVRLEISNSAASDLSPLAAVDPDVIQVLSLWKTQADDDALKHVATLRGLKHLDANCKGITDEGANHLQSLKALEVLLLHGSQVSDTGVGYISKLPALSILSLSGTRITDRSLAHIGKMKSLKWLILGDSDISDAGLAHLRGLTNLTNLSFWGNNIGDAGLAHLANLKNLEELTLSNTHISDAGMVHLTRLPKLKFLRLTGTTVGDAGMAHLAGLETLESLHVNGAQISDSGLAYIGRIRSLKTLHIGTSKASDEGLAHLATLENLEELDIGGRKLTVAGLNHVAELTSLKTLWIQNWQITDEGFAKLAALQSLERLLINGTKITGHGLLLLQQLPKLTELRLTGKTLGEAGLQHLRPLRQMKWLTINCDGLNDSDLQYLSGMKDLEHLNLRRLTVTDAGLAYLAGLTSLKHLELHGSQISDDGLKYLANMQELEYLWISGQITDHGLGHLAKLKMLRSLILGGRAVSQKALAELQTKLPRLQSLYTTQVAQK